MGRVALTMAILFVLLSLTTLSYLVAKRGHSAEFVIGIFALYFSLTFLLLVVWEVRTQVKREAPI